MKSPFIFLFLFLPSLFSVSNFFLPFFLFQVGYWPIGGGGGLITQRRWVVNFRIVICQNGSIVLNKVSTIAVKIIY